MSVGKILGISVVCLAGFIVLGAASIAIYVFASSRNGSQQNFVPPEGQQAVSPVGDTLLSEASGNSSFLYRKSPSNGNNQRLTSASSGIESEANFSHDGKLVVYSFASSPESKSSVWVAGADGQNPHPVTGKDEDALHPVFSPNDSTIFYATSSFTGNHSPIVRPARHDWDVFSVPVQSSATVMGTLPAQVTHKFLYDLRSLDVVSDGLNPGGSKLLVSTTEYPIGDLLEEFNLGATGWDKVFQPHVTGQSAVGPSFGGARFIHNGMDVLFLAATDTSGGNYDYNVYSMSDVTGSDVKQLTHLKGMTTELRILPNGDATFTNGGAAYTLNVGTQAVKAL
jgi:hypothetical protein